MEQHEIDDEDQEYLAEYVIENLLDKNVSKILDRYHSISKGIKPEETITISQPQQQTGAATSSFSVQYELGDDVDMSTEEAQAILNKGCIGVYDTHHYKQYQDADMDILAMLDKDLKIVGSKCNKCHTPDSLISVSRQIRSGDEGESVIYFCTKCDYKETVH